MVNMNDYLYVTPFAGVNWTINLLCFWHNVINIEMALQDMQGKKYT